MSFLKRNTAKRRPTVLNCNLLEAREVPAQLNLAASGSEGWLNGAFYQQADAARQFEGEVGAFSPFLRMNGNGDQEGYNTSARPLQYDTVGSRAVTHTLDIDDVPLVSLVDENGVTRQYREFVLDINQRRGLPMLSLDRVQVFSSDNDRLRGYNQRTDRLDGHTAVYDMDQESNNWIRLDARSGQSAAEGGDMRMYVLDSLFTGQYVYVYSHFGDRYGANSGAETWGTVSINPPTTVPPPPPATTGTLSGRVFIDANENFVFDAGDTALAGITIFADKLDSAFSGDGVLNTSSEVSVLTDPSGFFTLLNVPLSYIAEGEFPDTMTAYNVRFVGPVVTGNLEHYLLDPNPDSATPGPDGSSPYWQVSPTMGGLDFRFDTGHEIVDPG